MAPAKSDANFGIGIGIAIGFGIALAIGLQADIVSKPGNGSIAISIAIPILIGIPTESVDFAVALVPPYTHLAIHCVTSKAEMSGSSIPVKHENFG